MRITGAQVVDLTILNQRNDGPPILVIRATDLPDWENDFSVISTHWHEGLLHQVMQSGPLYDVRFSDGSQADAHALNTAKGHDGTPVLAEPLVDVWVHTPPPGMKRDPLRFQILPPSIRAAISLQRARDVLRKYAREYTMSVDTQAAKEGNVVWVPIERSPHCLIMAGPKRCQERATLPHWGRVYGICERHAATRNRLLARERTASKGAKA